MARHDNLKRLPAPRAESAEDRPASLEAVALAHALRTDPVRARALLSRLARPRHAALMQALVADGALAESTLAQLAAERAGLLSIDPREAPPDPSLADRWGLARCLSDNILPWHVTAQGTVILVPDLSRFAELRDQLTATFGPVIPALAPSAAMTDALLARRGAEIARAAETRVRAADSCRALDATTLRRAMLTLAVPLVALALVWPPGLVGLVYGLAFLSLAAMVALKIGALITSLGHAPEAGRRQDAHPVPPMPGPWPTISIIVALYREEDIAPRLVQRLGRLDYPRDRLEIVLVVEDEDHLTRQALMSADLPPWFRIVVAPGGRVRTKPRALNIALDQCRGSIVGVYDAEDAPEPDQLRRVAAQFATAPPDVVCLQGILDFYNAASHPMARCFTLEYATWFRLMLQGFDRMRLVLPLGGTTLFFRREALDRLGAWDAHNVTEDADLGLRLARHGWRTEMLDSVTWEEANCHPLSWVKQRSRWIKGYMMTWIVHSMQPLRLWRDLGPRRFIGMQAHFAGSIAQGLLAPAVWSLWIVTAGLPHPVHLVLSDQVLWIGMGFMVFSGLLDLLAGIVASHRIGGRVTPLWVLLMPFYNAMATLSAYKALSELATRPFYWDKTTHGTFGG